MNVNIVKSAFMLGLPVFVSYIPAALTFGLLGKSSGFSLLETFIFPSLILSGSAQFMAVNLFMAGTNIFGIFFTIFLMSFRFFLMSSALVKKLHSSCKKFNPLIVPLITDESFTLASLQEEEVKPEFILTIQVIAYVVWSGVTVVGYTLGDILPTEITLSLGLGIYALFLSMLIPQMKKSFGVTAIVVMSAGINWGIKYFNLLPNGWNIIIAILVSSFIGSFLLEKEEEKENE